MLCGIRLRLDSQSISELNKNPTLDFKSQISLKTDTVNDVRVWKEHGMTIWINDSLGFGHLKGSLHMYKNAGRHNYDDFSWTEVFEVLERLSNRLMIDVGILEIIKMEWGVNVVLGYNPSRILPQLVMHHGEPFKDMYVYPGRHFVCSHSDYNIKCYNKSAQYKFKYNIPPNLMRIEVSTNKARLTQKLGIEHLCDLRDINLCIALSEFLMYNVWENILLIEPLLKFIKPKNRVEERNLAQWGNPLFWQNASKSTRYKNRQKYQNLIDQHIDDVHSDIHDKAQSKINALLPFHL